MREPVTMRPQLGGIRSVTYAVPDLRIVEESYPRWLGYRIVERGEIRQAVADAWHAPGVARRPVLTLGPSSGEPVYLRFVSSPEAAGWRALTTHGWNVSEIIVQDVDALAAELIDSPFRIIGPPTSLQRFPMIRAMQVIGPLGECLYFTQVGEGSGLELAPALSFVGRVFIVVAGGPDLAAMFRAYERFANEVDPPVATRVRVISLANELPPDTEHLHGLVKLRDGTMIELDQYPAATRPRALKPGMLPPGMALVTFDVDALLDSTIIRGAAGELIELQEASDA